MVLEDLLHGKPLSAPLDGAAAAKNGSGKGGREGVGVFHLPSEDAVGAPEPASEMRICSHAA